MTLLRRQGTKGGLAEEAIQEAGKNGFELTIMELESLDKFTQSLEKASAISQALIMILDQEIYNGSTAKELLLFSARKKYPVIAISPNYVQAGALLSISSDFYSNGATAGKLGISLLKGEEPPIHFLPTEKIKVAWNERIADLFGIPPPPDGEVDEKY